MLLNRRVLLLAAVNWFGFTGAVEQDAIEAPRASGTTTTACAGVDGSDDSTLQPAHLAANWPLTGVRQALKLWDGGL